MKEDLGPTFLAFGFFGLGALALFAAVTFLALRLLWNLFGQGRRGDAERGVAVQAEREATRGPATIAAARASAHGPGLVE